MATFQLAKIRNPNAELLNKSEIRMFKCLKRIYEMQFS